jgi:hypothetical protein
MTRKVLALAMFVVACGATLYVASDADANTVDEAPAPRAVGEDKKAEGKGKFGGFDKGKFGGKVDPEKLKGLKEKFGGKFDPEKFKDFKGKFGKDGKFGKGGFGKKKDGEKKKEGKEEE